MFPGADIIYKLMYLVGFAFMMVINLRTYKKYKLSLSNTIIITLITYGVGVFGAFFLGKTYAFVLQQNGFDAEGSVAIFGAVIFTPLIISFVSIAMKQNWKRVLDMLAPGIFMILSCAKFGCGINGCCNGIECSFGMYNPRMGKVLLPIQFIEVFFMTLIIVFCFWYALKSKKYTEGTVYPVTSILYCAMRFVTEFFRYYQEEEMRHIISGVSFWQFCCILVAIVSAIWIIVLKKNKKSA